MKKSVVRIVVLEPLRVTSVHGFGAEPETEAWRKLEAWAGPKGYLEDLAHHRIFGFNNPNPSPSTPNYGYELWMVVGPEEQPEGEARILDFEGGMYAVTRCDEIGDPYITIPAAWQRLVQWLEDSQYRGTNRQCLEEHLRPADRGVVNTAAGEWILDLYLPIAD